MVIVIGAGPAGLAMGRELQKRQVPFRILEKHDVGYAWRNHYDSLRLHTLKQVSGLPDMPMPANFPRFPTKDQVVAYLEQYVERFDLPIERGVTVDSAEFTPPRWTLQTSHGSRSADAIVAATGIWGNPVTPAIPGLESFSGEQVQAWRYQNPQPFVGKRVLVVGAGNTGSEIATELAEAGIDSHIVIRSGVRFVPYPKSPLAMKAAAAFFRHVPPALGNRLLSATMPDFSDIGIPQHDDPPMEAYPVVGFELPEAVAAGRVTVWPGITRFSETSVFFQDGSELAVDVVIWAIGYRPKLAFAEPYFAFAANGWPRLTDRYQSTFGFPLYCISANYPANSGWLQNIGRVSATVADHIAA